eukprot:GHVS01051474.1.p1 GENE.GHVS01051474.1~~GHVS01051474.1.p1  ORF type:complete len:110 (-),score=10.33 GHVS01051474.1:438-767(-)
MLCQMFGVVGCSMRSLFTCSAVCRAPKGKGKKGGGTSVVGASGSHESGPADHVFNIYTTIAEDHKLLPDESYPSWLWDLEKPKKTYGQLSLTYVYGQVIKTCVHIRVCA